MAKLKIAVVECAVGLFAFDEQNENVDAVFFPKMVEDIIEAVERLQGGESVDEAQRLVKGLLKKGYREFVFENEGLAEAIVAQFKVKVSVEKPSKAGEYLRSNMVNLAIEKGFVTSSDEFYTIIHDVSEALARRRVTEASGKRVLLVSQAILTLDDLDKTLNLFANRLREWYGHHFPELGSLVEKSDLYVQLIASLGERRNFIAENLAKMNLSPERAEAVSKVAKTSMGAEIGEEDVDEISGFAKMLIGMQASREKIECYLDLLMKEVAPNIRELAGSTLGARLIAATGGLGGLSKKSSSTIQMLGAEKALFRSLKTGTRPPKHGLIFQHKDVHQSPRWQRGKIARALAGKLAIAARLDFYGGEYRGDALKKKFDARVEEIKTKYAEPSRKSKR